MDSSDILDLILLVPDLDIERAINEILNRPGELAIRSIGFKAERHPGRDPGCFNRADTFLRPFQNKFRFSMVLFDHDGSGQEDKDREAVENLVEGRLERSGWQGRSCAICIAPELENWLWVDSPHLLSEIAWPGSYQDLKSYLITEKLWAEGQPKPARPKEAFRRMLYEARIRPAQSTAIIKKLAAKFRLQYCSDAAFNKFKHTLQSWFPPDSASNS